jgi:hypothetical protein
MTGLPEFMHWSVPPPPSIPPHVCGVVVHHPGCGQSVTDFWGWGTHKAQLRCHDDVSDDMYERGVPGGALNLNSTGYPHHGQCGDLPLQGKIPTAEPWIEPAASGLVVRRSEFQASRLVWSVDLETKQWHTEGGVWGGSNSPRKSEVLTKLSRIPSSMENTSVTT